jgi:hypothetical protein
LRKPEVGSVRVNLTPYAEKWPPPERSTVTQRLPNFARIAGDGKSTKAEFASSIRLRVV